MRSVADGGPGEGVRAGGTGKAQVRGEGTRRAAHCRCCSEESWRYADPCPREQSREKNYMMPAEPERPSGQAAERIRRRACRSSRGQWRAAGMQGGLRTAMTLVERAAVGSRARPRAECEAARLPSSAKRARKRILSFARPWARTGAHWRALAQQWLQAPNDVCVLELFGIEKFETSAAPAGLKNLSLNKGADWRRLAHRVTPHTDRHTTGAA